MWENRCSVGGGGDVDCGDLCLARPPSLDFLVGDELVDSLWGPVICFWAPPPTEAPHPGLETLERPLVNSTSLATSDSKSEELLLCLLIAIFSLSFSCSFFVLVTLLFFA